MNIPGFTAEVSFGEVKDSYALALRHAETTGIVLPQFTHCECFYDSQGVILCRCFPVQE
jgi:hypothetical protein